MKKQIILRVDGGIVDSIKIPEGIEVVVRDYDMVNTINNEMVQTDEDGKDFVEIVFDDDTSYAI